MEAWDAATVELRSWRQRVQGTNRSQEHWSPLHQSGDRLKISSNLGAKHHTSPRWVVGRQTPPSLLQDARTGRTKRSLLAEKVKHISVLQSILYESEDV